jgi:integrase
MRKEICLPIDLTDFKTLTEDVDKIYLSQEEIDEIVKLDLTDNKELDEIRDYLLIGCYTGLRFSDFSTIETHHIKGMFLKKRIGKIHRSQTIPLKKQVIKIFDKYENKLPKIDKNNFNKLVKIIGEKAKINEEIELVYKKGTKKVKTIHKKFELISSHTCRRSFCTNEYLAGTPIFYIMKISGHKTQKSFMRYLKIDEDDAAEKMMEIWKEREKVLQNE